MNPMVTCCKMSSEITANEKLSLDVIIAVMAIVKMIAIGSLVPDSISNVEATRCLIFKFFDWKIPNTAAASVELKIAPMSNAVGQGKSKSSTTPTAVSAQVIATPSVAKVSAGPRATLKRSRLVRIPPSKIMTISANEPMTKASSGLSNPIPNTPSSSASIPTTRNVSNRSEEHTSELQSRPHLVCRLLLEKNKKIHI